MNLSPLLVVLPSHCYNICYLKYFSHTFFLTRLCDNPALLVVWEEARIWTQGTQNVSPSLDFCSGACATASSANEYCFAVDTTCTLLIRDQMLRAQRALAIKSPCVLPSALWQDLITAGDKLILVSKSCHESSYNVYLVAWASPRAYKNWVSILLKLFSLWLRVTFIEWRFLTLNSGLKRNREVSTFAILLRLLFQVTGKIYKRAYFFFSGRKRTRIRNSVWFFLRRKIDNRRYMAVFNWRKAMWWT